MNTEKLQLQRDGETMEFEGFTNCLSRVTAETILNGRTYPVVPFVRDVNVVMDIGANVEPRPCSSRSRAHNFGLYSSDQSLPLYRGKYDSGMSSVAKTASPGRRPGAADRAPHLVW